MAATTAIIIGNVLVVIGIVLTCLRIVQKKEAKLEKM
jgi:hypothetical protein